MSDTHDLGPCRFNGPDFTQPTWWWLSFADTTRPEGDHFLGVVIVQAPAVGANPGGQVVGWPFDGDLPAEDLRERLLTKDDLIAAGLYVGNIEDNGGWENYL